MSSFAAGGGELIRLSLGPAANSVTSHLCNLEGLAITGSSDNPLCDPNITHSVWSDHYVPRVLFVDGRDCFYEWNNDNSEKDSVVVSTWKGRVETHFRGERLLDHPSKDAVTDETRNDVNATLTQAQILPFERPQFTNNYPNDDTNLVTFQSAVFELQSKPHSRHCVSHLSQQVSSQFVYTSSQHKRYVDWDSIEDEEDHEDAYSQHESSSDRRTISRKQSRGQSEIDLSRIMDESWDRFMESSHDLPTDICQEQKTHDSSNLHLSYVPWMCYFMPPHPPKGLYSVPLPMDCNVSHGDTSYLHSYIAGHGGSSSGSPLNESHWHEQVLGEALRRNMESCDAIRGFQIMVDDDFGIFGGITCRVLEHLEDECKSTAKIVTTIKDGIQLSPRSSSDLSTLDSWRSEQQARQSTRSHINSCMNLFGALQYSNLVLPISLHSCVHDCQNMSQVPFKDQNKTLFLAAANAAMALEAGTLSYRLHGKNPTRCMTGLTNRFFDGSGQGDDWYSSTPKLTFHEFVASLKPSNRHTIIELSSLLARSKLQEYSQPSLLQERFFQGTSIDRQIKEMKGYRGYKDSSKVEPGSWLDDYGSIDRGILTSLSPMIRPALSRSSLHRYFALCSTFRGSLYDTSPMSNALRNHTTALMEAMAIRFRPESSVGTVVNQSLMELTAMGPASAAGSYWKGILKRDGRLNTPVLSVLGNSTRVHPYLHETTQAMKEALSRKNYGYLTQDVMAGILPERDDCKEALESCVDLRETYGTYLQIDDEGTYFESNDE